MSSAQVAPEPRGDSSSEIQKVIDQDQLKPPRPSVTIGVVVGILIFIILLATGPINSDYEIIFYLAIGCGSGLVMFGLVEGIQYLRKKYA